MIEIEPGAAGIVAFGQQAVRWSKRLPRGLPILVVELEGVGAAMLEAAQRRRDGRPFFVCPIVPDQRSLAARRLSPAILANVSDTEERRRLFFALRRSELVVDGKQQATFGQLDFVSLRGIRDLIALADGVLVRSFRERTRIEQTLLDHLRDNFEPLPIANLARLAPPATDIPAVVARPNTDGIVVWAPYWNKAECSLLAFALSELHRPVTFVCGGGDAAGPGARFVARNAAASILAGARVVFVVDEEPGAALAFAELGFSVAAPSTSGAEEWIDGVAVYYPWDIRSILTAASDALGFEPMRLHGNSSDTRDLEQRLAASAPPKLAHHPLVSLVVPTRNRRAFLPIVLRALATQEYPKIEIIIINDGVSVADLCEPYANVRLYEPGPALGFNEAYNFGIKLARGKYVGIQPDDDPPFPDHVARLVAALEHSGAPIAHAKPLGTIVDANACGGYDLVGYHLSFDGALDRSELLVHNTIANTILFRRELLERYGFYDDELGPISDYDLWLRINEHQDFVHVPRVTCELITRRDGSNASYARPEELARYYQALYSRHSVADRPQLEVARLENVRAVSELRPLQPSLPMFGEGCKNFVPPAKVGICDI